MLIKYILFIPCIRIALQVSSVTRTARTQPSSRASKSQLFQAQDGTYTAPGFFGVEIGEPTVPKRKGLDMITSGCLMFDRVEFTR